MKHEETYKIICEEMNLDYITAMDNKNARTMVYKDSRSLFFYITRITTDNTFQKMADFFEKNHATAIHGVRFVSDMLECNTVFKSLADRVINRISYIKVNNDKFKDKISVVMSIDVYNSIPQEIQIKFIQTNKIN